MRADQVFKLQWQQALEVGPQRSGPWLIALSRNVPINVRREKPNSHDHFGEKLAATPVPSSAAGLTARHAPRAVWRPWKMALL
jgi:hypothetical protein